MADSGLRISDTMKNCPTKVHSKISKNKHGDSSSCSRRTMHFGTHPVSTRNQMSKLKTQTRGLVTTGIYMAYIIIKRSIYIGVGQEYRPPTSNGYRQQGVHHPLDWVPLVGSCLLAFTSFLTVHRFVSRF